MYDKVYQSDNFSSIRVRLNIYFAEHPAVYTNYIITPLDKLKIE